MKKQNKNIVVASSCLFLLYVATLTGVAEGLHHHHHGGHHHHRRNGSAKLFVFGDSYVDTGNIRKSISPSWKQPYGITFPGKPAGRFSDGRVLTDYLASFLGIRSPIPYELRKYVNKSKIEHGMNFAYGGTGVFDTLVQGPNLTTQIDFFEKLLEQKVYTKRGISSSIALVTIAGNDYSAHFAKHGNDTESLAEFTKSLISQLVVDLKRIHGLGVRKLAVTALEPIGCLPALTSILLYKNCSEVSNLGAVFHNLFLNQKLDELNKEAHESVFVIVDLYSSFLSALKPQQNHPGNSTFEMNPLKPCCVGVSSEYSCGSVDQNGEKKYTICDDPKLSFFWDSVHPSQNGWHQIYSSIKPSLHKLYS